MKLDDLKDPLIVSGLFFIVASNWFDDWLRDLFPSLRTGNAMMYTLIKTIIFAALYWLYHTLAKVKVVDSA